MITLLNNLESTERPFLGPNYWLLKKIKFIMPESNYIKIFYIIMHQFLTILAISEFIEIFMIWPDCNLVISSFKVTMLTVVCVVKVNTFIVMQKNWQEIFDYVTEADKFERMDEDPVRRSIVSSYTKYSRRLTYFYWLLTFITYLTVTQPPLITYLSSSTLRQNVQNETEDFPPMFIAYMPLDKYHSPGCWITYVWHFLMCTNGASVMAAYDSCVVVIMVFFGGKLDLLRDRCRRMLESIDGDKNSDEECIELVRQIHEIQMSLIKYWRLFNSLISPIMFLYVVIWAVMICSSAFQLSLVVNTADKFVMVQYLVFGIAQLFMFCWHSNEVMLKNKELSSGPFESNWYIGSSKQRKTMLILSGQLGIKNVFTAGPFADLTISTFVNILKGAYSYYALLRK